MQEVTILLSLISIGVTLVLAVLTWIAKELLNLKPKVNDIFNAVFGREADDSKGLTHKVDEVSDTFQMHREERQAEHREVQNRLESVEWKTTKMAEELSRSDNIDVSVDLSEIGNRND